MAVANNVKVNASSRPTEIKTIPGSKPPLSCPAEGDATEAAHRAQNQAKNNFCAVGSPGVNDAIRITVSTFETS
jgi:hypothetical protein